MKFLKKITIINMEKFLKTLAKIKKKIEKGHKMFENKTAPHKL